MKKTNELDNIKQLLISPNYNSVRLGLELAVITFEMSLNDIIDLFNKNDVKYSKDGYYELYCFKQILTCRHKESIIFNLRKYVKDMILDFYLQQDLVI